MEPGPLDLFERVGRGHRLSPSNVPAERGLWKAYLQEYVPKAAAMQNAEKSSGRALSRERGSLGAAWQDEWPQWRSEFAACHNRATVNDAKP